MRKRQKHNWVLRIETTRAEVNIELTTSPSAENIQPDEVIFIVALAQGIIWQLKGFLIR